MSSKRNGARVVVAATVAVLAGAGAVWAAGERVEEDWAAIVGRDNIEHLRDTLSRLLQPHRTR